MTHQNELIEPEDHINEEEEEQSQLNGGAFVNQPLTSNMQNETLTGLVKIEPIIQKVSLIDKQHHVGLDFSRQLFNKLSGSFEVSQLI